MLSWIKRLYSLKIMWRDIANHAILREGWVKSGKTLFLSLWVPADYSIYSLVRDEYAKPEQYNFLHVANFQVLDLKPILHPEKNERKKDISNKFLWSPQTTVELQLHDPPLRSKLNLYKWNIKQSVFFQCKSTFLSIGGFGDIAAIKNLA